MGPAEGAGGAGGGQTAPLPAGHQGLCLQPAGLQHSHAGATARLSSGLLPELPDGNVVRKPKLEREFSLWSTPDVSVSLLLTLVTIIHRYSYNS